MRPQPIQPPGMLVPKTLTHAYKVGGFVFISGQVALDERGGIVAKGDFEGQVNHIFANLGRILEAAGGGLQDLVKSPHSW